MKQRRSAGVLLLASLVVGCGSPAPTETAVETPPSITARPSTPPSPTPAPTPTPDMTGWRVVREDEWGYAIGIPADWVLVENGIQPQEVETLKTGHPALGRILDRVADDVGDRTARFAALAPDASTVILWRLDEEGLVEVDGIDAYVAGQAAEIARTIDVMVSADFHPRIRAQRIWDGSGDVDLVLVPRGEDVWQLEVLVESDPDAVGELLRAMLFRYEELPG